MAIEGIVGVAVGLTEDDKIQCLKVLVARKMPELVAASLHLLKVIS
jgi:hypothetical protein